MQHVLLGSVLERTKDAAARGAAQWGRLDHRRTIVVLAAVLALDQADRGSVGALAPTLKQTFHVGNTEIGVLAGAFSIVAGVATLPMGVLVDKVRRTLVLSLSIAAWTIAMLATGLAASFAMLFTARMFLGLVTAASGPTVASITGDLFPPRRRSRVLSLIESGELVGIGFGFLIAGAVMAALSWRWVFHLLAIAGLVLAWLTWRLPEPARCARGGEAGGGSGTDRHLVDIARDSGATADPRLRIAAEQADMPLWDAVRYALRVRTNIIAMVSVSIGNFFFAGLKTFAVVYVVEQYGIGKSAAALLIPVVGVGALAGLVIGGRIADHRLRSGDVNGRIEVGAIGYLLAPLFLLPALLAHTLTVALPLYMVAAAALTAPTPSLDAVRLDIIHPRLWGRAEGIRTTLRTGAEAVAPILFGFLADHVSGGGHRGLQIAFLITLPALVASGLVTLIARRTYAREVLAAAGL